MSLIAVARAEAAGRLASAAERDRVPLRANKTIPEKKEAVHSGAVQRAVEAVVEQIPAEVVGAYIAVLPALPRNVGRTPQIVLFLSLFILTPILQWGLTARQLHQAGVSSSVARRPPWRGMTTSTVSFVVWAAALPDSVAQVIPGFQPYMALVAIVALQVALLSLDGLFPRPGANTIDKRR